MSGGAVIPCPKCPERFHCYLYDFAPSGDENAVLPLGSVCRNRYKMEYEITAELQEANNGA